MAATFDELLEVRTRDEEVQSLLSVLQAEEFPVTDYHAGGGALTLIQAIGSSLADKSKLVNLVTRGGLVALAAELEDPAWLTLLALYFYDLERSPATFSKQLCRIACQAGLGPVDLNPGFVARATSGRRYIYQGTKVQVPDGGVGIDVELHAESPGSLYSDPAGTITEIVTSLPGLSIDNPNPKFGGLVGTVASKNPASQGSGTVTPSAAGTPSLERFYTIRVLTSGAAGSTGSVLIEWEEGAVRTSNTITPIPASYVGAGDGVTMTFADGVGAGFIVGDIHTFQTPGSPILAHGLDEESNASLARRCIGRWPSLGENIVTDKYRAWIEQASKDAAYGIEKVTISPSLTVAGQTNIIVATAAGAPAGSVITALQDYVTARDGVTDSASVLAAANENISITGTVIAKLAELEAVKEAADLAWATYIKKLPIGGDISTGSPGVVRLSELVQAIMDAGAVDYQDLKINAAAANYELGATEVAVIPAGQEPSVALTWQAVS